MNPELANLLECMLDCMHEICRNVESVDSIHTDEGYDDSYICSSERSSISAMKATLEELKAK